MYYTIHQREPLGMWKLVDVVDTTFEGAAKMCWDLLVKNGGEAVEARFCRTHTLIKNWTYIPQFTN